MLQPVLISNAPSPLPQPDRSSLDSIRKQQHRRVLVRLRGERGDLGQGKSRQEFGLAGEAGLLGLLGEEQAVG